MKAHVRKGDDFLSVECTLGDLLDKMGLITDVPCEYEHGSQSYINADIVIEVRRERKEK